MNRNRSFRAALALAAFSSMLAAPTRAAGQAAGDLRGGFAGAGIGVGAVTDPTLDTSRFGPMLHGRAGWGFAHGLAAMVELGVHGLGDEEPRNGDVVVVGQNTQVVRRPSVLGTVSVLASLQVGLPGRFFARPGVGVGRHAFPTYNLFGTDTPTAETSHEAGPAAGLALGRVTNLSRRIPVSIEGVALWSHGEDGTGSRWAAGLQVVPMIRF